MLQDPATQIPVSRIEEIVVDTHSSVSHLLRKVSFNGHITSEMEVGLRPNFTEIYRANRLKAAKKPMHVALHDAELPEAEDDVEGSATRANLLLVHGYCVTENPWLPGANDFKNAAYFTDPSQSIPNDEFARRIASYSEALGMRSFGIIAHSQGGLA